MGGAFDGIETYCTCPTSKFKLKQQGCSRKFTFELSETDIKVFDCDKRAARNRSWDILKACHVVLLI
jgi:hypothetical protein